MARTGDRPGSPNERPDAPRPSFDLTEAGEKGPDERLLEGMSREELLELASQGPAIPDELVPKEGESPVERAARLNRAAQRGVIDTGFLVINEMPPGHTMDKHVGKSEAFILARAQLTGEASTFGDKEKAEIAIAQALRAESEEIDRWLGDNRATRLAFDHDLGWTAGKVAREDGTIRSSRTVRVVLVQTASGYQILTAYLL